MRFQAILQKPGILRLSLSLPIINHWPQIDYALFAYLELQLTGVSLRAFDYCY